MPRRNAVSAKGRVNFFIGFIRCRHFCAWCNWICAYINKWRNGSVGRKDVKVRLRLYDREGR